MLTNRAMSNMNIPVFLLLGAMTAIAFAQVPQGGPHISQWGPNQRRRELDIEYEDLKAVETKSINLTTCDPLGPKMYCHDCTTRVICKPMGGILKQCGPWKRYCNNGLCSIMPSPNCVIDN